MIVCLYWEDGQEMSCALLEDDSDCNAHEESDVVSGLVDRL